MEQALASNQNLRVAAARLEQARDQVTVAASDLYPCRRPVRRRSARQDLGESSARRIFGPEPVDRAE